MIVAVDHTSLILSDTPQFTHPFLTRRYLLCLLENICLPAENCPVGVNCPRYLDTCLGKYHSLTFERLLKLYLQTTSERVTEKSIYEDVPIPDRLNITKYFFKLNTNTI